MQVMKNQASLTTTVACFIVLVLFLHLTLTSVIDQIHFSVFTELESWTLNIRLTVSPSGPITCDRSHDNYDLCSINGPALLDPTTATLFSIGPTDLTPPSLLIKTRPYPRKRDEIAMSQVKELTLTSALPKFSCGVTHATPALVFSTGGYTGNFFHAFMDGFVPLYITINSLFPDDHQDVILVITDYKDWWGRKYGDLLHHFTRHPIINMDNETTTHCFPSVIGGLISHGPMIVDPNLLPYPKTLFDFQAFLENACSQDPPLSHQPSTKPRLLLVNRNVKVGRMILNLEEVKKTAKEVGFDVTIFEPTRNTSLVESFRLIHASHAMLGVHGAALTHFLFLRPGSVLMQVVPIGTRWLSDTYFRNPARELGLEYLEYRIKAEESSLAESYGANDMVLTNPKAFAGENWSKAMRVYLKTQNVKLDMVTFKRHLREAYKKAKRFMDKESYKG